MASVRRCCAIVALAGCGRLGFDAHSLAGDGGADTDTSVPADSGVVSSTRVDGGWPANTSLTIGGARDWFHWGYGGANGRTRKAGATAIADFTHVGGGTIVGDDVDVDSVRWTDGTPTATATNVTDYLYLDTNGTGDGFRFSVAADVGPETLTMYVGNWCVRARLESQLDDGSAPFVDTSWEVTTSDWEVSRYLIDFNATNAGHTLTVAFTVDHNYCTTGDVGELGLMAVTLE